MGVYKYQNLTRNLFLRFTFKFFYIDYRWESVTQSHLAQEGSGGLVLFFWPSFIFITNKFPVQVDSFKIAISNLS